MIAVSGAPGCGKSTLCQLLCRVLDEIGTAALVVSLDNYYLGRKERRQRTALHPLFAQRGAPGTHDWHGLIRDLDRIRGGQGQGLRLPAFDKGADDRAAEDRFFLIERQPTVVFLEGWLVGAPPQPTASLEVPLNRTEREHDPGGQWRRRVNDYLERYHHDLEIRLGQRWFLAAPDWQSVIDWRWQQEREREQVSGRTHLKDRDSVTAFLEQFQRISLHMLASAGEWADVVIRIDKQHRMKIA